MAIRAAVRVARPLATRTVVGRPLALAAPLRHIAQRQQSSNNNNGEHAGSVYRSKNYLYGIGLVAGTFMLATSANRSAQAEEKAAAPKKVVDYGAVRKAIVDLLDAEGYDDGSRGPLLVRLAWHAAGTYDKVSKTGGSDGATMRYMGEAGHGANAGLAIAREALEVVKKKFPEISYADLWTLAGGVAIEEMGGPKISWRPGRSDYGGPTSLIPDGRLPDAAQGAQHVRDVFYRMGFNDQEIVALLGAHSMGRCHEDRSGFKGPWTRAPTTFSNEFYRVLLEETWTENKTYTKQKQFQDKSGELMMLPADLALVQDPEFKKYVELYSKDEQKFFKDFASAWTKLMELGCHNLSPAPISIAPIAPAAEGVAPSVAAAAPTVAAAVAVKKEEAVGWWKRIFG